MWKLVLALGVGSAVSAAPVPKELRKAEDKDRIVGTWTMTACNVGGRETPGSWRTLTLDADGLVRALYDGGKVAFEYATTLDPTAAPKRMPFRDKGGSDVRYECVYALAADRLTVVVPHDNKRVPMSIDPGPRVTVYEFKRADSK